MCFILTIREYLANFDGKIQFIPIAHLNLLELEVAENLILRHPNQEFQRVGRSREWFKIIDRKKMVEIIAGSLNVSEIRHRIIQ
jgi:hypothetical protein